MGALKEEEKIFSRAVICFSGFDMAFCLFWVGFFLPSVQAVLTNRRCVHKGFSLG